MSMLFKQIFRTYSRRQRRIREFQILPAMLSTQAQFEDAKLKLSSLKVDPGVELKIKMYALFKQATIGKNTAAKPNALDFAGQVKWRAWNDLGEMPQVEAKQAYIDLVAELVNAEGAVESIDEKSTDHHSGSGTDAKIRETDSLIVSTENKVTTITYNRPHRCNALILEMYEGVTAALSKAASDDSTSVVVFTGNGKYYSSGNDLKNFESTDLSNIHRTAEYAAEVLRPYVASFIDFPKPLIAAINGPAIGIPVSQLGFFDAVYAADNATFRTPFSKIGQSPEACSSYLFPKMMGHTKASSMLLFGETITAAEAERLGLVSSVFPEASFRQDVEKKILQIMELPIKSLVYSKQLMRYHERDLLHKINEAECARLVERWTSEDCINAVLAFLSRK